MIKITLSYTINKFSALAFIDNTEIFFNEIWSYFRYGCYIFVSDI